MSLCIRLVVDCITGRFKHATRLTACTIAIGFISHIGLSLAELPEPSADDFRLDKKAADKESEAEVTSYADLFSGQAVYSIPLNLPDGTGGAKPDLALTYRSGRRSGYAGVGWSLDIPSIARTTKHGAMAAYDAPHDQADYELAGEKLIRGSPVTGPTPAECTGTTITYVREVSRFERVYYCEPDDYFIVAMPNGTVWRYGTSPRAKQITPDDETLAYHLSEVIDRNGLAWRVSYWDYGDCNRDGTSEPGVLCAPLPKSVSYTYNGDSPVGAQRRIDFTWQNEGRTADLNLALLSYRRARLTRIDIKVDSQLVRHYRLNYKASEQTGASLLDSVSIYSGSGTEKLWRRYGLDYANDGYGFTSEPVTPGGAVQGFLDPVTYYHGYANQNYVQNHNALGFRTMVTSTGPASQLQEQEGMGPIVIDSTSADVPDVYSLTDTSQDLMDIDGDGLRDMVQVEWKDNCGDNAGCYRWYVRKGLGDLGFSSERSVVEGIRDVFLRRTVTRIFGGDIPKREPKVLYEMVDVNRDGLLDLFTSNGVYVNVGGSFELKTWDWNDPHGAPMFLSDTRIEEGNLTLSSLTDVDGDGCVDHLYAARQWGYTTDGTLTGPATSTGAYTISWTVGSGGQTKAYLHERRDGGNPATHNVTGRYERTFEGKPVGSYTYKLEMCFYESESGQEICHYNSSGITVEVTEPVSGWMVRHNRMCDPEPVMGFASPAPVRSPGISLPPYVGRTLGAFTTSSLVDINGDGLVDFVWDKVWDDGKVEILFGTGSGFVPETTVGTSYAEDLFTLTGGRIFAQKSKVPGGKDEFPPCVLDPRHRAALPPDNPDVCGQGGVKGSFAWWYRTMAFLADFNGDGRPDVIKKKGYLEGPSGPGVGDDDPDGPLEVYVNTGAGFLDIDTPITVNKPTSGLILEHFFAPQSENSLPGDPTYKTATEVQTAPVGRSKSAELMVMSYPSNYNNPPWMALYANTNPTPPDLLTRIDNGRGTTIDFNYGIYLQGLDNPGTNPTLPFRRVVLDTVRILDEPLSVGSGYETSYISSYRYANGYYDEEFRGFGEISVTDSDASDLSASRRKTYYFHVGSGREICAAESGYCVSDEPAFIGRSYLVAVYELDTNPQSSDPKVSTEVWSLYDIQPFTFGGQTANAPVSVRRIEYERESDQELVKGSKRQRMTHYEHDNFGNVVGEHRLGWFAGNIASLDADAGDGSYSIASEFAAPIGSRYLVNRPSREEVYQGDGATRTTLQLMGMKYDDLLRGQVNEGNLTESDESIISSTGVTNSTVTAYGRDDYGNPTSLTVGGDLIGTFEYQSPEHIYVSRKTAHVSKGKSAPLSLVTRYWWDDALGVINDEVDPAGRWLSHRYDAHGREIELWSCPPEQACESRDQATVLLLERAYNDSVAPRKIVTKQYFTRASEDPDPCDVGCGPNGSCSADQCVCRTDYGNCNGDWSDGCERDLTTSSNCGACGNTCANDEAGKACVMKLRAASMSWSCGCKNDDDCSMGYECWLGECRIAR